MLLAVSGNILAMDAGVPSEEIAAAAPIATRSGVAIAPGEDVSMYPEIRIRGGWHPLIYQSGPRQGEVAFSTDDVTSIDTFLPVLWDLFRAGIVFNWTKLGDIGVKFIRDIFHDIRLDGNSQPINPDIGCGQYSEFEEHPYEANVWIFSVDWRLDPWDNAQLLQDCIIDLQAKTGVPKVNISSISGGGQLLLTYLERFKTDKLASIVFNMSMHDGSSLFGGLATRNVILDALSLSRLFPQKKEDGFSFDWIALLLRVAYETGVLDLAGKWFKWASGPVMGRVYDEAVVPYIFTMPQMWNYVPTEQYERAKDLLLGDDPQYDALKVKIDRYRYQVLAKRDKLLLDAASKIKVAVRAGYGVPMPGLTTGTFVNSDGFVDVANASFGAACAPLDRPFPASYKPDNPFISPDRMVDASTCLLPELTWFSKYQKHRTQTSFSGWYKWFLRTEGDYTVFADERYPQYQFFRTENTFFNEELGETIYNHNFTNPQPPSFWERYLLTPLLTVVLWGMKAWRFILLLPLFWV